MAKRKDKVHVVEVTLTFDRPVTGAAALRAARDHIYGDLYSDGMAAECDGWLKARVRKVRRPTPQR